MIERPYTIRRSVDADQHDVLDLEFPAAEDRKTYFGRVLLGAVIETSVLTLTATDPDRPERIVGFAAFDSTPPGDVGDDAALYDYLLHKYDLPRPSTWAFLTYFAQRQATLSVLKHLLHTFYCAQPLRERVLLVLPRAVELDSSLSKLFVKVPLRTADANNVQPQSVVDTFEDLAVYECPSREVLPPLHVRTARVEDHDDLEPILRQQNDAVVHLFGDYFLAELIRAQDASNVCLVAQDATRAVGLVAVSDEIDIATLHDSFELAPLNNLAPRRNEDATSLHNSARLTPPQIVICGPPAGGKGTQCELLVEEFGVVHLSTGDMLRAAIAADSPLGLEAQGYMNAGELVPDELIIDVIIDRLQHDDCVRHGWLLDGFPRTAAQAQAMLLHGIVPDVVVVLDVPDEEVISRISGRRVDPETGKTYHITFNPPPANDDALRARLIQRADDTEATIRNRLSKFHENCDAVVESFATCARVLRVSGTQPKHVIAQTVCGDVHACKDAQKLQVLVQRQRLAPPKLIITGPPAGGKGTQCELLVEQFGVVHLSTGDMLRASILEGAPLGMKAQGYMNAGELVPDELIIDVIIDRLQHDDCVRHGWLLDGFPRTAAQARAMLEHGIVPDCVLVLDVPDEEVISRISGRRVDPVTNKTYHITFNPPPLDVLDRVVQRSDDNEATIANRLRQFHANCDAVLGEFAACAGVNVVRCDGMQSKHAIAQAFAAPTYKKVRDVEATFASGADLASLDAEDARANCFAVTLLCVDGRFAHGAADLLVHAFAAFATKDYCLITLPTTAREPSFLTLFTPIAAKATSTFTHALYVLHRDAIAYLHPSSSDGLQVLEPLMLSVDRYDPVLVPDLELESVLRSADPKTRIALQRDIASASDERDVALDENPTRVAFIVRANGAAVGIVTLSRNHDVASGLKNYFDLDARLRLSYHRSRDQAFVDQFVLNPVFQACTRSVLESIMRLFRKSCLFYCVPAASSSSTGPGAKAAPPVSSLVHDFVLAPPRRSIAVSADEVAQYPDDAARVQQTAVYRAFALFVFTKKLLAEPKLVVNQRLVVVGASDAALALLMRLLAVPYLRFSNITLVSPHGLEIADLDTHDPLVDIASSQRQQQPDPFDFARRSLFSRRELAQFSLRTHIRVIASRVVQLDRLAKAVVLQDGACLPYDYLALTTGLQDGTCIALGRVPTFDGDLYTPAAVPPTVVSLHDVATSTWLHDQLLTQRDSAEHIVVYGSSLLALQVVNALLVRGIDGTRIVHIAPTRDAHFDDATVRMDVERAMASAGVTTHYSSKVVHLVTAPDAPHKLEAVHITHAGLAPPPSSSHHHHDDGRTGHSHGHHHHADGRTSHSDGHHHHAGSDTGSSHGSVPSVTVVPCAWLLCCQQNDADYDMFRAINESGLVYDGRLVVNGHMRTTDPYVFGAGSLCRFSRRFIHAKLHEHYSAKECGELLAASLLRVLDPLTVPDTVGADDNSVAIHKSVATASSPSMRPVSPSASGSSSSVVPPPEMHMPVVRAGVIVGGKHYVQISVPSLTNTLALQALPTTTPSRYTNLQFDDVGVLNRLEYFGTDRVDVSNLQCVVGLHESYLNSALSSYSTAYVTDWLAFLREKWAAALYHDRFPDFVVRLGALLRKDDGVRQLVADVAAFYSDTGDVKGAAALAQVRVGRGGDALEPSTKRLIESQLLEFLSANRELLTMYLLPRTGASAAKKKV